MKNLVKKCAVSSVFCITLGICAGLSYFLLGAHNPERRLKELLLSGQAQEDTQVTRALFSPDDDLRAVLLDLIGAEKKRIITAIYTITEKQIAKALVDAFRRGVAVEIVVDRGYGADKFSKVPLLANNRIPVWVYQCLSDDRSSSIMHDKFCVFEKNFLDKSIIWTGSYNFTQRAGSRNQENVIILDNQKIIDQFNVQFEKLKARSLLISGTAVLDYAQTDILQTHGIFQTIKDWFFKRAS